MSIQKNTIISLDLVYEILYFLYILPKNKWINNTNVVEFVFNSEKYFWVYYVCKKIGVLIFWIHLWKMHFF